MDPPMDASLMDSVGAMERVWTDGYRTVAQWGLRFWIWAGTVVVLLIQSLHRRPRVDHTPPTLNHNLEGTSLVLLRSQW